MSGGVVRDIYVAIGVYSENLVLVDGVNLYGGYSLDYRRRDISENPTTVFGRVPEGQQRGTVTAIGLVNSTVVDGFDIYGAEAQEPGASSYGVFILDCGRNLTLANNDLFGSSGRKGALGTRGARGPTGPGGAEGNRAISLGTRNCQNQEVVGGLGGQNQCGGINVSGGNGGNAECPVSQRNNGQLGCRASNPNNCRNSCSEEPCGALPPGQGEGQSGFGPVEAEGGGPTYARWTDQDLCGRCSLQVGLPHIGFSGQEGERGAAGAAGLGCRDPSGTIDQSGEWTTEPGQSGEAGIHGSGGGGGGAGSGLDVTGTAQGFQCVDRIGGSGGGGGAGGCAGAGGLGGGGGGGSFVVMIQFTQAPSSMAFPISLITC